MYSLILHEVVGRDSVSAVPVESESGMKLFEFVFWHMRTRVFELGCYFPVTL